MKTCLIRHNRKLITISECAAILYFGKDCYAIDPGCEDRVYYVPETFVEKLKNNGCITRTTKRANGMVVYALDFDKTNELIGIKMEQNYPITLFRYRITPYDSDIEANVLNAKKTPKGYVTADGQRIQDFETTYVGDAGYELVVILKENNLAQAVEAMTHRVELRKALAKTEYERAMEKHEKFENVIAEAFKNAKAE